jgi:hypothetical protein
MMTFAARYGHTPPNITRRMPVTELIEFVGQIAKLLEEESAAVRSTTDD